MYLRRTNLDYPYNFLFIDFFCRGADKKAPYIFEEEEKKMLVVLLQLCPFFLSFNQRSPPASNEGWKNVRKEKHIILKTVYWDGPRILILLYSSIDYHK